MANKPGRPKFKGSKALKADLDAINHSRNLARTAFSFKNARTFRDMMYAIGYTPERLAKDYPNDNVDRSITFVELNDYFNTLERTAREKDFLLANPPSATEETKNECTSLQIYAPSPTETTTIIEPDEPKFETADSVWSAKPPGQTADLHPKQAAAAKEIFDAFFYKKHYGRLLLAQTGHGKTYVFGNVLANLIAQKAHLGKTFSPWPYVVVTKASVVIQTERVLSEEFGLDVGTTVHVINIDKLRSSFGSMMLEERLDVVQGEVSKVWRWRQWHPFCIIWDECQILKNEGSEQSKIAQDFNRCRKRYTCETLQLFSSATPFTTVSEARCFAVSTGIHHDIGFLQDVELIDEHWHDFARQIAHPADPEMYSPAAMDRFRDTFEPFITQMKGVRSKFHARNGVNIIDFKNEVERAFYTSAWDRFLEEKRKIEGEEGLSAGQTRMMILVQFLKFRQAAELCRAPRIAEFIVDSWNNNQAGCAAVCFKETINKIVWHLINEHGWTRDDISIIWGGNVKKKLDENKKAAVEIRSNDNMMAALKNAGISLDDLGLDYDEEELTEKTQEELDFEKEQDLGPQDYKKRQREIDRFQQQKTKCCLFTFKSGGVGLSLHHQHKHTRQRTCILTPTYSAMELVQGLGRCPRLTSLSDTPQIVVFYRGTIEEHVAARVSMKLKCLSKFVRQRESWESVIIGQQYETQQQKQIADDVDDAIGGTYIEDEENNEDTNINA